MLASAAVAHRAVSNLRPRYNDGVVPYLTKQTEESDDILIIGNYAWPYLAADRTTQNRFFFQWPPIQVSDELYRQFLEELDRHPSDVVILAEHENAELKIPGEGKIDFELQSAVIHQYGNHIKKVAYETLERLGVSNVKLKIVDKGALDCTLKARIEGAVYRAVDQYENLPWGGAIR